MFGVEVTTPHAVQNRLVLGGQASFLIRVLMLLSLQGHEGVIRFLFFDASLESNWVPWLLWRYIGIPYLVKTSLTRASAMDVASWMGMWNPATTFIKQFQAAKCPSLLLLLLCLSTLPSPHQGTSIYYLCKILTSIFQYFTF